jgi:hypothetical protein
MASSKGFKECIAANTANPERLPESVHQAANQNLKGPMIGALERHVEKLQATRETARAEHDAKVQTMLGESTPRQYTSRGGDPTNELNTFRPNLIRWAKNLVQRLGSVIKALKETDVTAEEKAVIEKFNAGFNPRFTAAIEKIFQAKTGKAFHHRSEDPFQFFPNRTTADFEMSVLDVIPHVYEMEDGSTVESILDTSLKEAISATAYEWIAGDGWFRLSVVFVPTNNNSVNVGIFDSVTNVLPSYTGDISTGFYLWGAMLHEGMYASDRPAAPYIKSTTGAVQVNPNVDTSVVLSFGGRYNDVGAGYLTHGLIEPGEINKCTYSRQYDDVSTNWSSINLATESIDQVGIDGVANTASTITDNDPLYARFEYSFTSTNATYDTLRVHVGKTSSASSFPAVALRDTGNTEVASYAVNTDSGTVTGASFNSGTNTASIQSFNDNFWEVTITRLANSTSTIAALYPAVNTDASSTQVNITTGSAVFDQVDIRTNQSWVGTPILTSGGEVQRNPTNITAPNFIPAIGFQIRGRGYYGGGQDSEVVLFIDDVVSTPNLNGFQLWKDASNSLKTYFYTNGSAKDGGSLDTDLSEGYFNWGAKVDSTGIYSYYLHEDGTTNDLSNVTAIADPAAVATTMYIGQSRVGGNVLNGGLTDITIYTGPDTDWYKDTTWASPAVNYQSDYIPFAGKLIPADSYVTYDQPFEEAA